MNPPKKIIRFDMGNPKGAYSFAVDLIPKVGLQIRQEAVESSRRACIRFLEKELGKNEFHFKIRRFPFHILRENKLGGQAGADRTSTGMKHSFGKPIGSALQIKKGQKLFSVNVKKSSDVEVAKVALLKASKKLPCKFDRNVVEL